MKQKYTAAPSGVPAVLFVKVGWAEEYDGETTIVGNHRWLVDGNGDDCSEMEMYIQRNGEFHCGIGRGVPKVKSLDVVFVAKSRAEVAPEVVAIYFDVICYRGDSENWMWARTSNMLALRGPERRRVEWPAGQGMRRWANREGTPGREHLGLFEAYGELISTHGNRLDGVH